MERGEIYFWTAENERGKKEKWTGPKTHLVRRAVSELMRVLKTPSLSRYTQSTFKLLLVDFPSFFSQLASQRSRQKKIRPSSFFCRSSDFVFFFFVSVAPSAAGRKIQNRKKERASSKNGPDGFLVRMRTGGGCTQPTRGAPSVNGLFQLFFVAH